MATPPRVDPRQILTVHSVRVYHAVSSLAVPRTDLVAMVSCEAVLTLRHAKLLQRCTRLI
jgi:hypothetical protein